MKEKKERRKERKERKKEGKRGNKSMGKEQSLLNEKEIIVEGKKIEKERK